MLQRAKLRLQGTEGLEIEKQCCVKVGEPLRFQILFVTKLPVVYQGNGNQLVHDSEPLFGEGGVEKEGLSHNLNVGELLFLQCDSYDDGVPRDHHYT